jgi:heat shock protein HslJ
MRPIAFAFAVTLFLAACASAAPQVSPPDALQLAGTRWRFVEVQGHDVPASVRATLVFESNGHVSGRAGCNGYGGPWAASNGALHFGGMISTKMACLEPSGAMETERGVFAALRDTASARMRDHRLVLVDAKGATLASLEPQDDSQ